VERPQFDQGEINYVGLINAALGVPDVEEI
jgi:hypothetical protein